MKHKKTRRNKLRQHGGMKFGSAFKQILISKLKKQQKDTTQDTLDKLIIQILFENATEFNVISDKSRYSIVFSIQIPDNFLLDTTGLSLEQAVDIPTNDNKGTSNQFFCVKLTYIQEGQHIEFPYNTTIGQHRRIVKSTMTPNEHYIEVQTQKDIYDSLNCRDPSVVFVPDILATSICSPQELQNLLINFNIDTPTILQLSPELQRSLRFGITVMEFFPDRIEAYTLTGTPLVYATCEIASHQIIIATKLKMLLYDYHLANAIISLDIDGAVSSVKSIDFGSMSSLHSPDGVSLIKNSFEYLLDKAEKNTPNYPTILNLCHFFSCQPREITFKFISALEFLNRDRDTFDKDSLHEILMILAFVDLMINNYKYRNHRDNTPPNPNIFQMSETIRNIYGGFALVAYTTFSGFLHNFIYQAQRFKKEEESNYEYQCFLFHVVDKVNEINHRCKGPQKTPYELSIIKWLDSSKIDHSLIEKKKSQIDNDNSTKVENSKLATKILSEWKFTAEAQAAQAASAAQAAQAAPTVQAMTPSNTRSNNRPKENCKKDKSCSILGGTHKYRHSKRKRYKTIKNNYKNTYYKR